VFGIELNHQEDSLVLVKSTITSEDPETREKTKVDAYHTMTDPEFEKLTNQVQNKPNVSASSIGIYPSSIEKVGKDLIKEVRELVKNEKRAKATKLVAERLGIGLVPARQWIAQRVKGFN
ncbi:MAG: hypothetical protein ACPG5T_01710, partial [Endozoicomonas sp.]